MSEALLNLSKVLEVLFPPTAEDRQPIDSARAGLLKLRYKPEEIEKWYARAMHLRNQLDVGHVSLVTLGYKQLQPVHDYTAEAEEHFREMLLRVINAIVSGTLVLRPYRHRRRKELEDLLHEIAQDFPPNQPEN
jgi:hypothetical protein